MEWLEFVELVRDMRKAQRAFFGDKTSENMREAKRLEREVDSAVGGMDARGRQLTFFDKHKG